MNISLTIKEILRGLVKDEGSQLDFSRKVKISQASIARYLSGDIDTISASTLQKIKKQLVNKLKTKYADALRACRKNLNKERNEIAALVGLTESELDKIENEEELPTPDQWQKLSSALKIKLEPPPLELFNQDIKRIGIPKLQEIRKKIPVTQTELSVLSGVSQRAISAYETSPREPSREILEKLALALSVKPHELMMGLSISKPQRKCLHKIDPVLLAKLPEELRELMVNYDLSSPDGKKELLEFSRNTNKIISVEDDC